MKIPFIAIFFLLGMAGIFQNIARANPPKVTEKERILASLLAGHWVESDYYTKADCARLCGIQFRCPAAISDCPFADQLGDADKLEVKRAYFNFSGSPSRVATVVLTPAQYWGLVRQVEKVLDDKQPLWIGMAEPMDFYQ